MCLFEKHIRPHVQSNWTRKRSLEFLWNVAPKPTLPRILPFWNYSPPHRDLPSITKCHLETGWNSTPYTLPNIQLCSIIFILTPPAFDTEVITSLFCWLVALLAPYGWGFSSRQQNRRQNPVPAGRLETERQRPGLSLLLFSFSRRFQLGYSLSWDVSTSWLTPC